jgi:hypothetical protein
VEEVEKRKTKMGDPEDDAFDGMGWDGHGSLLMRSGLTIGRGFSPLGRHTWMELLPKPKQREVEQAEQLIVAPGSQDRWVHAHLSLIQQFSLFWGGGGGGWRSVTPSNLLVEPAFLYV